MGRFSHDTDTAGIPPARLLRIFAPDLPIANNIERSDDPANQPDGGAEAIAAGSH